MRCFLAALLLLASPAYAEKIPCAPTKELLAALLHQQYTPQAELALGDLPGAIFVNPSHEYLIIELKDDKSCIIGGGVAFYLVRERKA